MKQCQKDITKFMLLLKCLHVINECSKNGMQCYSLSHKITEVFF